MGIKMGIDVGATTCRAYYVDGAGKLVQAVLEKECIAEHWKSFLGNA